MKIVVLKFGGTSVGSTDRIKCSKNNNFLCEADIK